MKDLRYLIAAAAAIAAAPSGAKPLDPEARLAQALAGRVAGQPVRCIELSRVRSTEIVDHTAILYHAGGTLFVNRPESGRESLDQWDTLVTETHSSTLCSVDVVRLYDPSARIETGTVFLGDFVPYRKVR